MHALLCRVQQRGELVVLALTAIPLCVFKPVVIGTMLACSFHLSGKRAAAGRDRRSAGGGGVDSAMRSAFARGAPVCEWEPKVG